MKSEHNNIRTPRGAVLALSLGLVLFAGLDAHSDTFLYQDRQMCRLVTDGVEERSWPLASRRLLVSVSSGSLLIEDREVCDNPARGEVDTDYWFYRAPLRSPLPEKLTLVSLKGTRAPRTAAFSLYGAPYKARWEITSYKNRAFSLDARLMVFALSTFRDPENTTPLNALVFYSLASGAFKQITTSNEIVFSPTISPDNQWVAYYSVALESRPELYPGRPPDERLKGMALGIVRTDGSGERLLVPHGAYNTLEDAKISWSPDSQTIYFEYRPTAKDPWHAIYRVSLDGTGFAKVSGDHSLAKDPYCSKDGKYLACAIEDYVKDGTGKTRVQGGIALIHLQTSSIQFLTNQRGMRPKLSPSGTQLIYNALSDQKAGAESLWFLDIPSGRKLDLTPTRSVSTDRAFWMD